VTVPEIENLIFRLQHSQIIYNQEFQRFLKDCKQIVTQLFYRYKLNTIVYKPCLREDIINDVAIEALVKALHSYDPTKSRFFTYYYNKSRSLMGVKQGIYYRRFHLINTVTHSDCIKGETVRK